MWYVFSIQKVDFEYSVSGNELEIAKVVALRKRKTMCKVQINEIERLEKDDTEIKKMRFLKTFMPQEILTPRTKTILPFSTVPHTADVFLFLLRTRIFSTV